MLTKDPDQRPTIYDVYLQLTNIMEIPCKLQPLPVFNRMIVFKICRNIVYQKQKRVNRLTKFPERLVWKGKTISTINQN